MYANCEMWGTFPAYRSGMRAKRIAASSLGHRCSLQTPHNPLDQWAAGDGHVGNVPHNNACFRRRGSPHSSNPLGGRRVVGIGGGSREEMTVVKLWPHSDSENRDRGSRNRSAISPVPAETVGCSFSSVCPLASGMVLCILRPSLAGGKCR